MRKVPLAILLALTACADATDVTQPQQRGPAVDSVAVEPSQVQIVEGASLTLKAKVFDNRGKPIERHLVPQWESSQPTTAEINSVGRLTAIAPGTAVITATVEGKQGRSVVTVVPTPIGSVEIVAPQSSILTGDTLALSALVRDEAGNLLSGKPVTWSSGNTQIATVDSAGIVIGRSAGMVTIRATAGNRTGTFTLSVSWANPSEIRIDPPSLDVEVGEIRKLTATSYDRAGNPLPTPTVRWASNNPAVASVDTTGRVTALSEGTALIEASHNGISGAITVSVRRGEGIFITEISPSPLVPGQSAVIQGVNFAATTEGNTVLIDGIRATILSASSHRLEILVPETFVACQPTRLVDVVVETNNTPTPKSTTRSHPLATAPQANLTAGEVMQLLTPAEVACIELPSVDGEYRIAVFNAASSGVAGFRLIGVRGAAPSDAIAPSISVPALSPTLAPQSNVRFGQIPEGAALHAQLLEQNRRLAPRRPQVASPASGLATQTAAALLPSVGDLVTIRVPKLSSVCDYTGILGRVAYVGSKSIVVEDASASTAGRIDAALEDIGREFDQVMMPILEANFGNPLALDSQLDNNGRIIMVFTPLVNQMGQNQVNGFVTSVDFLPPTPQCPASNHAEIFYAKAPLSLSEVEAWKSSIRSTIIHEVKHLTSYAERISRNAPSESIWLEEATAMISEELYGRTIYGYSQNANTNYAASLKCEIEGCPGKPRVLLDHFAYLAQYMADADNRSPLYIEGLGDYSYYGSGWAFVRWSMDQYASSEATFLRSLVQDPTRTGLDNLLARTGTSLAALLADFHLALATDDHPGFASSRRQATFPSWNLRDIFANLSRIFGDNVPFLSQPYPLQIRQQAWGDFSLSVPGIRAGSAAHVRLTGTPIGTQLLRLEGIGGGTAPTSLGMAIVRIR